MKGYHFDRSGAQRLKDNARNHIHPDISNNQSRSRAVSGRQYEPDMVRIRNDSGGDVPDNGVLRLDSYVYANDFHLETFRNEPVLKGITPSKDEPFCVLQGYCPESSVVRGIVSGVTTAIISVSDSAHEYCGPTSTTEYLASSDSGPARILWKESGTGVKRGLVLLSETIEEVTAFFLTPADGMRAAFSKFHPAATGCRKMKFENSVIVGYTPEEFEGVYNHTLNSVGSDKLIQAKKINGYWFIDVEPCD